MGIRHSKVITVPDLPDTAKVRPSNWNEDHVIDPASITKAMLENIATERILGRSTAGSGPPEELTPAQMSTLMLLGVNAKAHGVVGGGVVDDRAALITALTAAKSAAVRTLVIPSDTYRISKYLDVAHVRGLRIIGEGGATIVYPSDDTTVVTDAVATSVAVARAAILLRYTTDVTITGITFRGGSHADISRNQGPGIYATHAVATNLHSCNQIGGDALIQHDAITDTKGTGDSLTFDAATGLVTLADTAGLFVAGHGVGSRYVTIVGAAAPRNNGVFRIVSWTSATTIVLENPGGVTETSPFAWQIDDADRGLRIWGGRSFATRGNATLPPDFEVVGHTFEQPDTHDVVTTGGSFAVSGTTVTYANYSRKVTPKLLGKHIVIANATTAAHNGRFKITGATARSGNNLASVTYENLNAGIVAEAHPGTGWILNGDKGGLGAGAGALTIEGGAATLDAATDLVTRTSHGYATGTTVRFTTTGSLSGTGLVAGVAYFVIQIDANTFKLATTSTNAYAGTAIDLTGAGTGVHTVSAGTTLTVSEANAFHASDLFKALRIHGATTAANNGTFAVQLVNSATQVTYNNFSGVAEAFGELWSLDGFDRTGGSSNPAGSGHFLYFFAGRSMGKIIGCVFKNGRKTAVKISGSSLPGNDFIVTHCTFDQCANAITWGADDTQEHNNLSFVDNTLIDCATGRAGWNDGRAVDVLGCRTIDAYLNRFYYTQNAVGSVNGGGVAANFGLMIQRYTPDVTRAYSQPCESANIDATTFAADPDNTTPSQMLTACVSVSNVGQRAYWATAGTLTKTGNTVTLTDTSATWGGQLVGQTIEIVNSAGGNDGTFVITNVGAASTTLTYENAAATSSGVSAGTYRIFPAAMNATNTWQNAEDMGGVCRIDRTTAIGMGGLTVQTTLCVAPQITRTSWAGGGSIKCSGDVMPFIDDSLEVGGGTGNAHIQLVGVSWPTVTTHNRVVNAMHFATTTSARDMTVGISSTVVDHPLLGVSGRARPTDGYEEVVFAYGDGHVDGDTINVSGTAFTYKRTSPTGAQFNSAATLIAAINATVPSVLAADYGSRLVTPTAAAIGHIHVRRVARSTSDSGGIHVRSRTLNPTALVVLRNHAAGTPSTSYCYGRGAASTGTIPDKTVVWSPHARHTAIASLEADNDVGRTLLNGSAAQGLITAVAKASLVDGETITIGDGISPAKVYEFDVNGTGVTAGNVQVNVSADTTAAEVAARLRTAILANQPALAVVDNANGTLTVTHNWPGVGGNVTMTETVANAGFLVAGLANGGQGGYRQLRNVLDGGCCALMQHAKSTNQANTDLGAELRWSLAA